MSAHSTAQGPRAVAAVKSNVGLRLLSALLASFWVPCLGCLAAFPPLDTSAFLPPMAAAVGLAFGTLLSLVIGLVCVLRKAPALALLMSLAPLLYGPLVASACAVSVNELADTAPPTQYRLRVDAVEQKVLKGGREIFVLRCTAQTPAKRSFVLNAKEVSPDRVPAVGEEVGYAVYGGALGIEYVKTKNTSALGLFALMSLLSAGCAAAGFFGSAPKNIASQQNLVVGVAERAGFVVEPEPHARPAIAKPWVYEFSLRARLPAHPSEARPALYRGPAQQVPYAGPHGYLVLQKTPVRYERFIVACFLGERMRIDLAMGQVRAQLFAITKKEWPGSELRTGDPAFDARYNIHMVSGESMLTGPKTLAGTLPVPDALRRTMLELPPALDASLAYDGAWMAFTLGSAPDDASLRLMLAAFESLEAFVPTVLDVLHRARNNP